VKICAPGPGPAGRASFAEGLRDTSSSAAKKEGLTERSFALSGVALLRWFVPEARRTSFRKEPLLYFSFFSG
jgi:hypothetical protein